MLSVEEMLNLYLGEDDETSRPSVIDLTGGHPELVPEWLVWVMEEIRGRGLEEKVYLWSDDNLSCDYHWRFLTEAQQELVAGFRGYGRVACFKGFDSTSFAFNTRAEPSAFDLQFDLFRRLVASGMDLYAYGTFTSPSRSGVESAMASFVDRLQGIHPNLPLRLVPLKIELYQVVQERLARRSLAVETGEVLANQQAAIEAWGRELEQRFSVDERGKCIVDIPLAIPRS